MLSFGPFEAEHVAQLDVQPAQQRMLAYLPPALLPVLEQRWSNTIFKDGRPVLCGGVIEQWPGNAILWSFVGSGLTPGEFIAVHRLVAGFVKDLPFRRVEMHVDADFPQAHRWARMLGFICEAPRMRAFLLDGRDGALYARVIDG